MNEQTDLNYTSLKSKAAECIQDQQLDEAISLLSRACAQEPDNAEAWFMLAGVNAQLGKLTDVVDCCEHVLALQPGNTRAHYNLGIARQMLGNAEGAIDSYRQVIKLEPDNALALNNLGSMLWGLKKFEEARQACSAAISCQPELAPGHYNLGLILRDLNQGREAEARFNEAVRLAPQYPEAHFELGNMALAREAYREAQECYQKAVQARPEFTEALFQLAHTLYLQKNYPAAYTHYQKVLQLNPAHAATYNNLGRLFEETSELEKATQCYKKGLELTSAPGACHRNLGRVYLTQKKYQQAVGEYQASINAEPGQAEGHLGLGQAYCELDRVDEARQLFREALEMEHTFPNSDKFVTFARYLLASTGDAGPSPSEITSYVTDLFDNYAEKFDQHLVETLQYKTPGLIYEKVQEQRKPSSTLIDILDLGCGTGLCGALFKDAASSLVGIDLSEKMIAQARNTDAYNQLIVGELVDEMKKLGKQFGLIIAADVFVYIGDLSDVFDTCHSTLEQNGLFAFSTERVTSPDFVLRSSGRFAHSDEYIQYLARQYKFDILLQKTCKLRMEKGASIEGTVHILKAE